MTGNSFGVSPPGYLWTGFYSSRKQLLVHYELGHEISPVHGNRSISKISDSLRRGEERRCGPVSINMSSKFHTVLKGCKKHTHAHTLIVFPSQSGRNKYEKLKCKSTRKIMSFRISLIVISIELL